MVQAPVGAAAWTSVPSKSASRPDPEIYRNFSFRLLDWYIYIDHCRGFIDPRDQGSKHVMHDKVCVNLKEEKWAHHRGAENSCRVDVTAEGIITIKPKNDRQLRGEHFEGR